MDVYICESSVETLQMTQRSVQSIAKDHGLQLQIMTSTHAPEVLLRKLRRENKDIYLIALDIEDERNKGLQVARAIRQTDPRGFIILIVDREGLYQEILQAHVEVLDIVTRGGEDYESALEACFKYIHRSRIRSEVV